MSPEDLKVNFIQIFRDGRILIFCNANTFSLIMRKQQNFNFLFSARTGVLGKTYQFSGSHLTKALRDPSSSFLSTSIRLLNSISSCEFLAKSRGLQFVIVFSSFCLGSSS